MPAHEMKASECIGVTDFSPRFPLVPLECFCGISDSGFLSIAAQVVIALQN